MTDKYDITAKGMKLLNDLENDRIDKIIFKLKFNDLPIKLNLLETKFLIKILENYKKIEKRC